MPNINTTVDARKRTYCFRPSGRKRNQGQTTRATHELPSASTKSNNNPDEAGHEKENHSPAGAKPLQPSRLQDDALFADGLHQRKPPRKTLVTGRKIRSVERPAMQYRPPSTARITKRPRVEYRGCRMIVDGIALWVDEGPTMEGIAAARDIIRAARILLTLSRRDAELATPRAR